MVDSFCAGGDESLHLEFGDLAPRFRTPPRNRNPRKLNSLGPEREIPQHRGIPVEGGSEADHG